MWGSTALIPPSFGTSIQNSFLGSTFIPLREVRRTDIQDALLSLSSQTVSQSSNLERYAARMGRELGGFPWLWSISSCFLGPSFHPSRSLILHLTATFLMTWYPCSKITFPFSVAKVHFCCLQPSSPNTHPFVHSLTAPSALYCRHGVKGWLGCCPQEAHHLGETSL